MTSVAAARNPPAQHVPDLDGPSLLHGVLAYESRDPEHRPGRATGVALGIFGVLSLLGGASCTLAALSAFYRMARVMQAAPAAIAYLVLPLFVLAVGVLHVGVGAGVFVRMPAAWRTLQRLTAITVAISLLSVLLGLGLALVASVSDGRASGIMGMLGLFLAGVWSVPFWWNVGLGAYLMRPAPRLAFAVSAERINTLTTRHALVRIMWITYLCAAAVTLAGTLLA